MTDTINRASKQPQPRDEGSDPEQPSRLRRAQAKLQGWRLTTLTIGAVVSVAGGIPLLVALGVLRKPHWYPLLDLAQTELRVRDVWSDNPPLVGLAGRINVTVNGEVVRGSHPGPLSFYALWPFYMVFGATAWALQAAAASLNLLAMTTATWIGHRRGGLRLALGVAAGLAVLARAYGGEWLTEAWNPYMPVLWWVVFLLAIWSVLCRDLALLPVVVLTGSLCMQTHIPYAGMVVGLGMLALGAIVLWFTPRRNESKPRRYLFFWGAPSLALAVLLWLPPIYEQFTRPRGNFWMIYESFSDPTEARPGLRTVVEVWLANLDPARLIGGHGASTAAASGSLSIAALGLLAVWAAALVYAWRAGHRDVLRLHVVLAVALALGALSISRIHGMLWYYLVLWSWGTTTLLLLATGWTAVLAIRDRWYADADVSSDAVADAAADADARVGAARWARALTPARLTRWGTVALVGVLVAAGAGFTYDAAHTDMPFPDESRTLSLVTPQVVDILRGDDDVLGGGEDGRYLVTWQDSLAIGGQGYGFLLELEREGFDVGVIEFHSTGATPQRVLPHEEATAELAYINGDGNIADWDARADATQIVYLDPRTPDEVDRFDEIRDEVIDWLRAAGLDEGADDDPDNLVDDVDRNLFLLATDPRLTPEVVDQLQAMMNLGLPTAVYLTPA